MTLITTGIGIGLFMFGVGLIIVDHRSFWKFGIVSMFISLWLFFNIPSQFGFSPTFTYASTVVLYLAALTLTSFKKASKVGLLAISTSRINQGQGNVFFRGEDVPARSEKQILPDTPVYIRADDGIVLTVEAAEDLDTPLTDEQG